MQIDSLVGVKIIFVCKMLSIMNSVVAMHPTTTTKKKQFHLFTNQKYSSMLWNLCWIYSLKWITWHNYFKIDVFYALRCTITFKCCIWNIILEIPQKIDKIDDNLNYIFQIFFSHNQNDEYYMFEWIEFTVRNI